MRVVNTSNLSYSNDALESKFKSILKQKKEFELLELKLGSYYVFSIMMIMKLLENKKIIKMDISMVSKNTIKMVDI